MNYITKGDTIIFAPDFNDDIDIKLISNYAKLIFSNYELNDKLFEVYENDDFSNLKYSSNIFNKSVNMLPQNITHLIFSYNFNQEVNMLPYNITNLTFGTCFNQKVNNLPQTITHLTFGLPRK